MRMAVMSLTAEKVGRFFEDDISTIRVEEKLIREVVFMLEDTPAIAD